MPRCVRLVKRRIDISIRCQIRHISARFKRNGFDAIGAPQPSPIKARLHCCLPQLISMRSHAGFIRKAGIFSAFVEQRSAHRRMPRPLDQFHHAPVVADKFHVLFRQMPQPILCARHIVLPQHRRHQYRLQVLAPHLVHKPAQRLRLRKQARTVRAADIHIPHRHA